jgi:hypothetical protein
VIELVTAPAAEVVSATDMKLWAKIDTSADDALVGSLCIAARQKAEFFTGRRFITQTLRLWLDSWPRVRAREAWWDGVVEAPITILNSGEKNEIDLQLGPVQSVSSVKYYGTDGTEYTMPSTDYILDLVNVPPRVVLGYAKIWPTTVLRPAKAVAVEFVAGYGAAGSAVPDPILSAIKIIGTMLYENRGEGCDIPDLAKALLDPYVVKRL